MGNKVKLCVGTKLTPIPILLLLEQKWSYLQKAYRFTGFCLIPFYKQGRGREETKKQNNVKGVKVIDTFREITNEVIDLLTTFWYLRW